MFGVYQDYVFLGGGVPLVAIAYRYTSDAGGFLRWHFWLVLAMCTFALQGTALPQHTGRPDMEEGCAVNTKGTVPKGKGNTSLAGTKPSSSEVGWWGCQKGG